VLVARIVAFVAGALLLVATLRAVVRTFVVPRGEQVLSSRLVFLGLRPFYDTLAGRHSDASRSHAVRSRFAAVTGHVPDPTPRRGVERPFRRDLGRLGALVRRARGGQRLPV